LILTVGDWLALHDIQQDYVSTEVLSSLELDIAGALPNWTAARGEWAMVSVSLFSRLVLLAANAALLLVLLSRKSTPSGG
jgi:hypothetical protein